MDIRELEILAGWYNDNFDKLAPLYRSLISPIQHNAQQQGKQPFEPAMNAIIEYLKKMDFTVLSLEQIGVLERLEIASLIGYEGAKFIENTIKTANYDPATGFATLNNAFKILSSSRDKFDAYIGTLADLEMRNMTVAGTENFITIRIRFQNEASIDNVTKFKDSGKDWYDIIRGLAVATNEAPENTRVIGAATGSIIFILVSTAAVTELLARISKHVTGIAKYCLEISHLREELRQKKMLTKIMEAEFNSLIDLKKKEGSETILAEVKPLLPDETDDKIPALTTSIKKLLLFNEKGGNVDFVTPDKIENNKTPEEGDAGDHKDLKFSAVREAIHQYQQVREQLKLLAYRDPESSTN